MNGQSLSPLTEKLKLLKQIIPEAFTEDKIDWEKLRITLGEEINFANERYVLNWAGKSDAFRLMQQPTTKTLMPAHEESVNFENTQNIFIEGENLDVLKILQKSYFGKVKMIYIDPPYNTGNEAFVYHDRFSETKTEYQKRVGDKDDEGYITNEGIFRKNTRENGQYHSNWLNMMMPRLFLARNLLRDDGVIFISIDDNEVHNLRLLMNEIFGEENFVGEFDWRKKTGANDAKDIAVITESVLLYAKNRESTIKNDVWRRDKDSVNEDRYRFSDEFVETRGKYYYDTLDCGGLQYSDSMNFGIKAPDGGMIFPNGRSEFVNDGWIWKWSQEKVKWGIENKFLEFFKSEKSEGSAYTIKYKVYQKVDNEGNPRKEIGRAYSNLITMPINQQGSADFSNLFDGKVYFSNPKPIGLIKYLLNTNKNKSSIILDFFAGSATTAHAVMQLNKEDDGNRKYILVQMPEPCDEKSEAFKAGYKTIADIAKERIRRAGKKIQSEIEAESKKKETELNFNNTENKPLEIDTGFKVFHLSESNFKEWRQPEAYTTEALAEQLKLFIDPVAENANLQNMVYELLLKSGKDLNVNIETCNGYHLIEGNELALILEKVDEQIITEVLTKQPKKVIALDRIFKGNDQLKTNTALQMKDAGVEFKTI